MKGSRHFAVLLVLLLAGGGFVNTWEYLGEARVEHKELKDFPKQIGGWEQAGGDQQFDNETLSVLRASDYLLRDYRTGDGRVAHRHRPALTVGHQSSIPVKSSTLELLSAFQGAMPALFFLITNTTESILPGTGLPVSMWTAMQRL